MDKRKYLINTKVICKRICQQGISKMHLPPKRFPIFVCQQKIETIIVLVRGGDNTRVADSWQLPQFSGCAAEQPHCWMT